MSNGPSFAEIIVSQLGKPKEPFGLEEFLVLLVILLGLAAWGMLEYGVGRLLLRLWRLTLPKDGKDWEPPAARTGDGDEPQRR